MECHMGYFVCGGVHGRCSTIVPELFRNVVEQTTRTVLKLF